MLRLRDCPSDKRDFLRNEGRVPDGQDSWTYEDWPVLPDTTDPATLGCIQYLLREAWKGAPIEVHPSRGAGNPWGVSILNAVLEDDCPYFWALTELEALVRAFEGAP